MNDLTAKPNLAGSGPQKTGHQIKNRGLARPVWTDEGGDGPLLHRKGQIGNSDHPAKIFMQIYQFKNIIQHAVPVPVKTAL